MNYHYIEENVEQPCLITSLSTQNLLYLSVLNAFSQSHKEQYLLLFIIYGLFGNSIFSFKVLNFMKNMIKHQL